MAAESGINGTNSDTLVSQYTDIFGTIQTLEAFILAPLVGGLIDFSGFVISKLKKNIQEKELRLKENLN